LPNREEVTELLVVNPGQQEWRCDGDTEYGR
jgi:hypothetical protein